MLPISVTGNNSILASGPQQRYLGMFVVRPLEVLGEKRWEIATRFRWWLFARVIGNDGLWLLTGSSVRR
jgi:hypothetical protein